MHVKPDSIEWFLCQEKWYMIINSIICARDKIIITTQQFLALQIYRNIFSFKYEQFFFLNLSQQSIWNSNSGKQKKTNNQSISLKEFVPLGTQVATNCLKIRVRCYI